VSQSGDVDRFCSSSDWVLPAALELQAGRTPFIRRGVDGYVALMWSRIRPQVLEPLEAMWGMACPVVGQDVRELGRELAAELTETEPTPSALILCGLESGSSRLKALASALGAQHEVRLGPRSIRHCASLGGGVDGFLARRSAKLRASLRRADRRAEAIGVRFLLESVSVHEAEASYARLLAVEAQSWKGRSGVGFAHSEMLGFYHAMLPRLAARGAVRLLFAVRDGRDVGYILGGVRERSYRGLQFSFAQGEEALSLGNLLQLRMIERLCAEGIERYDLGAEVDYKRRWAEEEHATVTLIALRR
jgi:hypothetical protein